MIYQSKEQAIKAETELRNQIENLEADLDIAAYRYGIRSEQVDEIEEKLDIARLQVVHAYIAVQKYEAAETK